MRMPTAALDAHNSSSTLRFDPFSRRSVLGWEAAFKAQELVFQLQGQFASFMRLILHHAAKLEGQPLNLAGESLDIILQFLDSGFVPLGVLSEVEELPGQREKLFPHGLPHGCQFRQHRASPLLRLLDRGVLAAYPADDAVHLGDTLVHGRPVLGGIVSRCRNACCLRCHAFSVARSRRNSSRDSACKGVARADSRTCKIVAADGSRRTFPRLSEC